MMLDAAGFSRVRLSSILPHLPDRERGERPAFMHTLALWDALAGMGCNCELWNAVISSSWKTQVICAVRMRGEMLDWHGLRPHDYVRVFPIFLGGTIERESSHEIIPGKRLQAAERYPEVREQVRVAYERALLEVATAPSSGEPHPQRL